ncbi:hypothetical protein ACFQ4Y_09750 [Kroppenstedtia sanguinis]|uniref:Uncharacterized protein n=1 Tax=Kroppenstedtia sanguinis TaxID=1380684 RepID=A0ABW4C8Z1_9BACL
MSEAVKIRLCMSQSDAHYGGDLVEGARTPSQRSVALRKGNHGAIWGVAGV